MQKCTEEGGGDRGRGEGRGLLFVSVFLFFFLKIKLSFNEHVKVFTMICIYYLSVKLLFEISL